VRPILFQLGPLPIHSYGFMLAAAFIFGILLGSRYARQIGENAEDVANFAFWILISGVAGARLLYVIVSWSELAPPRLFSAMKIWEGGLVYYGGFLGGALGGSLFCIRSKIDVWQYADITAPFLASGLMFGRFGCTLVGCCYGRPCPEDSFWHFLAITFPPSTVGLAGVPLYPTQLIEAAICFTIFLFLWFYLRPRRKFRGHLLFVFLILYAIERFLVELLRNDPRGFLDLLSFRATSGLPPDPSDGLWLSTSQLLSILIALTAIALWIWRAGHDKRLGIVAPPLRPLVELEPANGKSERRNAKAPGAGKKGRGKRKAKRK